MAHNFTEKMQSGSDLWNSLNCKKICGKIKINSDHMTRKTMHMLFPPGKIATKIILLKIKKKEFIVCIIKVSIKRFLISALPPLLIFFSKALTTSRYTQNIENATDIFARNNFWYMK